jgi:Dipeptidyl peptidase IV (DPP IV) N-terminal region
MLVYANFNDTEVGEMQFSWYGGLGERLSYPKTKTLRYPKVRFSSRYLENFLIFMI